MTYRHIGLEGIDPFQSPQQETPEQRQVRLNAAAEDPKIAEYGKPVLPGADVQGMLKNISPLVLGITTLGSETIKHDAPVSSRVAILGADAVAFTRGMEEVAAIHEHAEQMAQEAVAMRRAA